MERADDRYPGDTAVIRTQRTDNIVSEQDAQGFFKIHYDGIFEEIRRDRVKVKNE